MTTEVHQAPNLSSIQALRGLAALVVAFAHVRGTEAKLDGSPILGNWVLTGFGGVDLFFVISGFVMVWVTRASQGHASAVPRFWLARALRIYPLWWLVLGAVTAVWMVRPEWVYASMTGTPNLLRSYLLLPDTQFPLHAVGWTLIHEVWFYLVFGIILLAPKRFVPALLVVWAGIVTVGALTLPDSSNPFIKLIRHPLTLEFIMGAGVGLVATRMKLPWAKVMLQAGCLFLVLSAASIISNPSATFEVEWPRIWLFGLPCAMIVWGWVGLEQDGAEVPLWCQALGNWSYALYLIHVLVFAVVLRGMARFASDGTLDNLALIVISLIGAIVAAWVLHIGFERPVLALSRKLVKNRPTP